MTNATNAMKKILKGLLFLISFGFLSACLSPDTIRLEDKEKREMINDLFQEKAAELQPKINRSCENNYDKMVSRATDSLVNVYLDSINLIK